MPDAGVDPSDAPAGVVQFMEPGATELQDSQPSNDPGPPSIPPPHVPGTRTTKSRSPLPGTAYAQTPTVALQGPGVQAEQRAVWETSGKVYGFVLYRIDRSSGLRQEISRWASRPRMDLYDHSWIQAGYGGGDYVLAAHPFGHWDQLVTEKPVSFPGEPKGVVPTSPTGFDPAMAMVMSNPAAMQNPFMMMLMMDRMRPPPAPVVPVDNPEIAALRAQNLELQRSNAEVLRRLDAQRDEDSRRRELDDLREQHRRESDDLRNEIRDLKNQKPADTGIDKLLAFLPTFAPLLLAALQNSGNRQEKIQEAIAAQQRQWADMMSKANERERESMQRWLEMMAKFADPEKQAAGTTAMAGLVTNLLGVTARVIQSNANQGPPWYAEIIGHVAQAAKEALPMIPIWLAAKTNPEAAAAAMSQLGQLGGGDPGAGEPQLPAAKPQVQLPAPQPRSPAAPAPASAPAAAAPTAASTPAQAAPPAGQAKIIPLADIRHLASLVRHRAPAERLINDFALFYEKAHTFNQVPDSWRREAWWTGAIDDPVQCMIELFERSGEACTWPEDYTASVRAAAAKWKAQIVAMTQQASGPAVAAAPPPPPPAEPAAPPASAAPTAPVLTVVQATPADQAPAEEDEAAAGPDWSPPTTESPV